MKGKRGGRRIGNVVVLTAAVGLAGCLQPLSPEQPRQDLARAPVVAPPRNGEREPMPPVITRREGALAPAPAARAVAEENP